MKAKERTNGPSYWTKDLKVDQVLIVDPSHPTHGELPCRLTAITYYQGPQGITQKLWVIFSKDLPVPLSTTLLVEESLLSPLDK